MRHTVKGPAWARYAAAHMAKASDPIHQRNEGWLPTLFIWLAACAFFLLLWVAT